MKVTLDTNVLVSATFWTGNSFKIIKLIDDKKIQCILSEEIIEEYNRVANSDEIIEKVENKSLMVSKIVENVISDSLIVMPALKLNVIEDPDDNKILECAVEGKADCIISQDNHLLKLKEYKGIKILTPKEFLEPELRPEFIEEMKKIEKEKGIPFRNIKELRDKIEK